MLGVPRVVTIPWGQSELDPNKPDDQDKIDEIVREIRDTIREMEGDGGVPSDHAVALVHSRMNGNAQPSSPTNMFFVGASEKATELFGFGEGRTNDARLIGRSMVDFLDVLKYRMPRRQYEEFLQSQHVARSTWTPSKKAQPWKTPTVHIPIVFDRHPVEEYIGRAYLPIIVNQNTVERGTSWSTLRVLYWDVTSVTRKEPADDDFVYICDADPQSAPIAFAQYPPLNIFLCHNSKDKSAIEKSLLHRLADLSPESVHPWLDKTEILGGDKYMAEIGWIVRNADIAFVFLGRNGIGPTQEREIELLFRQYTTPGRKLVIVPILLDGATLADLMIPDSCQILTAEHYVSLEEIDSDSYLELIIEKSFPGRLVK
jgi:hypothetical protein